jgi:beta-phosphoglucomutase
MSNTNGRAAIWDVDGTLVDTAELHFQAWQAVCREQGRDFTRSDFAATFGQRNPDILRKLFGERLNPEEIGALGQRKEVLYRAAARDGVVLLPGVGALVHDLHEAGFVQAIGSSAPHANLELILRLTGIARYFDAVVGSEDTQRGKPYLAGRVYQ